MQHPDLISADVDLDLVEALTTAVVLVDAAKCLVKANSAAQSLLALSEAQIKGRLLDEILPDDPRLSEAVEQALTEARSFTERGLELNLPLLPRPISVDCTVSPLWPSAHGRNLVLLELTNAQPYQCNQLEGNILLQNSASSALLRGLAHEIKNPLGGIRGAAQLLERELEDQRLAEYTQIVIGEVDRLGALVDRMLGPSGQSNKQSMNVHTVLEHVRQVVEADGKGRVVVERDYDPSLPDVLADRDELVQAFLNLVQNAVQAANGDFDTVTLRTRAQRKFTIGAKVHRLVIRADVVDAGAGVAPEIANNIFLPLVSGRSDGSGLGLPIAQSLVNRQGGLIGFVSEPGRTVFSVWLPVEDQQ